VPIEKESGRKSLIRGYLQAGEMMPDGTREATPQGVPQGGPLSPLLANIVLDPLDKELESRGHKFARYADDFVVMVKSAKAAGRVMASLIRFAEDKLKLVVNRVKSQTAPLKACAFLGFQIGPRGKEHPFHERIENNKESEAALKKGTHQEQLRLRRP
jgi:RNA-directed DNA polymerase